MKPQIHRGRIQVVYPLNRGRMVLRTERDWEMDVEPTEVEAGRRFYFEVKHHRPHLHFKPCVREGNSVCWAEGSNRLAFLGDDEVQTTYPHFYSGRVGRIGEPAGLHSQILGRSLSFRVYVPAGYTENYLKRYPVLYVQDAGRLFFSGEETGWPDGMTDRALTLLDSMSFIDRTIVVALLAEDRRREFTLPGYELYGRAMVSELKPRIDGSYRTLSGPRHTALLGPSLGGVASFFMAWEWPGVFGNVACLSSPFSDHDDLLERVRQEPRRPREDLRIYLDSGWPGTTYESTLSLANALVERGFELGRQVLYLAFPGVAQNEGSWAARCHLPLQLFSGKVRRAARIAESSAAPLQLERLPPTGV